MDLFNASDLETVEDKSGRGLNMIDVDTLKDFMVKTTKNYIIVDCRFEYEYDGGHINNAILLNSAE
jgi:rhodanese-related sulfurtransferase